MVSPTTSFVVAPHVGEFGEGADGLGVVIYISQTKNKSPLWSINQLNDCRYPGDPGQQFVDYLPNMDNRKLM